MKQFASNLGDGGTATSEAWVGGMALWTAGAHLPANPTTADIWNGMFTIKNNTFGGLAPPVTFTKGVVGTKAPSCYFVLAIHNGAYYAPNGSKTVCT
jgi:branched-chain amino acid transport system substrate-binding protein